MQSIQRGERRAVLPGGGGTGGGIHTQKSYENFAINLGLKVIWF